MLRAAFGTILKRSRSQALILAAAALSILLATALLAAGPIYADAVYLAGAKRALRDAPIADTQIEATSRLRGPDYAAADARVTAALEQTVTEIGGETTRSALSESYALPGQAEDVTDLAVFAFSDGLERHAELVAGQWPRHTDTPADVEVAVSDATASALGLAVGERFTVQNRQDDSLIAVTIAGVFAVRDPTDPFWNGDGLWLEGARPGEAFTVRGPFVVPRDTFLRDLTTRPVEMSWRLFPAFEGVSVASLPELRERVQSVGGRASGGDAEVAVTTGLPNLIASIERSLLATRSSVLILLIQLALLAGYTIVLTAGLLVDQRAQETLLLRSRGADVRQLLVLSVVEGLLLVLPAVALGPWVAAAALRLLNRAGPLADVGLTLEPRVTLSAYALSALAGAVCLIMLTVPAVLASHAALRVAGGSGRQALRAIWQRGGLDIAVAVLALLGFLQLRRYERPVTETLDGQLSVDPLLVVAPTLGLLAGAILTLRLIPRLARALEAIARRGARLTPALGAWHLARRPQRYSKAALLLILAVGIGFFAEAYTRTWEQSQDDQAGYQIGADVSVLPSQRQHAIEPLHLNSAYQQLAGVNAVMPADVGLAQISRATGSASFVLIDSDIAADVVDFRSDLAGEDFPALMRRLTDARPALDGIELPGRPARLAVDISANIQQPCDEGEVPGAEPFPCIALDAEHAAFTEIHHVPLTAVALLQSADGGVHRLPFEQLTADGATRRYVLPLTTTLPDGTSLTPVYPLTLLGIDIVSQSDGFVHAGALTLHAVLTSATETGDDWQAAPLVSAAGDWSFRAATVATGTGITAVGSIQKPPVGALVTVGFDTGTSYLLATVPVTLRLTVAPLPERAPIPVLVSEHLLQSNALSVGDVFKVDLAATEWDVEVIGAVEAFPTLESDEPLVIIGDSETLVTAQLADPSSRLLEPEERWLSVDDAQVSEALAALRAPELAATGIEARLLRSQQLRNDPVTLGTVGALLLGFLAATIFAVVGFVVSLAVSAHERLREFALLRALGLSSRQLGGWLLLENGFLIVTSLICGTLLGLLLARSILPLVSLTATAGKVFPGVIVIIPWGSITLMQLSLLAVLAVASGILVAVLRRRGLGEALRIGDG